MHKLAEKIADCMKAKVEGMGIDNIEGQNLVEFELWSKIIKNLVCYDKDKKIIEAMDEAEDSKEAMKYIEMYENYPEEDRKGYRGQPRNSKGQYMSLGGRRSYEEIYPMTYPMTPEMYHMPMEEWNLDRDMDREGMGRMYYSEGNRGGSRNQGSFMSGSQGGSNSGMSGSSGGENRRGYSEGYSDGYSEGRSEGQRSNQRDKREGKSGQSRKYYMESKEMGKEKGEKMKNLEEYMRDLGSDVSELIQEASPEEKTMIKSKMSAIMSKIN